MANCPGTSKVPERIYKQIHTYRAAGVGNKRMLYSSGQAECPDCRRVIATRPNKDKMTMLVTHKAASQKQDVVIRRVAEYRKAFTPRVTGLTVHPYVGPVHNTVTAVGGGAYYSIPVAMTNSWSVGGTGSMFQVDMTSTTQVTGGYAYRMGDVTYTYPTNRVTVMTNQLAWQGWNQTYAFGVQTTLTNNAIYQNWNAGVQVFTPAQAVREAQNRGLTYARPVLTPAEEQARRQEQALALFERVEAERLATQSASKRALGTLLGLLTAEQREEYAAKDYFHVVGSKGNLYRIIKGSSGNIRRVVSREETGRGEAAFCVHSVTRLDGRLAEEVGLVGGHLPHEDHMIQQMLHLQIDEEEILGKANIHWGTRMPTDDELRRFMDAAEASERDRQRAPLFG